MINQWMKELDSGVLPSCCEVYVFQFYYKGATVNEFENRF